MWILHGIEYTLLAFISLITSNVIPLPSLWQLGEMYCKAIHTYLKVVHLAVDTGHNKIFMISWLLSKW